MELIEIDFIDLRKLSSKHNFKTLMYDHGYKLNNANTDIASHVDENMQIKIHSQTKHSAINFLPELDMDWNQLENIKHILTLHINDVMNIEHIIDHFDFNSLLDDMIYLSQISLSTEQREALRDYFELHCNSNQCHIVNRHFRRHSSMQIQQDDSTDAVITQILDTMHIYFSHYSLPNLNNCNHNKHVSDVHDVRLSQKYTQIVTEDTEVIDNSSRLYKYGLEFYYGYKGEQKHADTIEVKHKFESLKEELTLNQIQCLYVQGFQVEYHKSLRFFHSMFRKQNSKWQTMSHQHLLGVVIYCKYDQLQYEFSRTYREDNGAKHNNFYHLGKYLKQLVHQFGTSISDGTVKTFYHGVSNKLLFQTYFGRVDGIQTMGPLSTSSSIVVAVNFTNHNKGVVVHFVDDDRRYFTSKYFYCAWLSAYPNEQEYLFIQNNNLLKINEILDATFGSKYSSILTALYIINEITITSDDIVGDIDKYMERLVHMLIEHQLSFSLSHYKRFDSLETYAMSMMRMYCNSRTQLYLNYAFFSNLHDTFAILFDSGCNGLKLKELYILFPNIVYLEISSIPMSINAVNKLIECLHNMHQACKLDKIWLNGISIEVYHKVTAMSTHFNQIKWKLVTGIIQNGHYMCLIKSTSIVYHPTSCRQMQMLLNEHDEPNLTPDNIVSTDKYNVVLRSDENVINTKRKANKMQCISENTCRNYSSDQKIENNKFQKHKWFLYAQRLKNSLSKYCAKTDISMLSFEEVVTLLDNFICLLQFNDHHDFEEIYQYLGVSCDSDKCISFNRNHRDRATTTFVQNYTDTAMQQIIDKVHCHWTHSFDLGYRLNSKHRRLLDVQNGMDERQSNNDNQKYLLNTKIITRSGMLNKQRTFIENNIQINPHVAKYNQLNVSNAITDEKCFYSFGFEFYYGYSGENKHRNSIVISPKYAHLKDELTMNNIYLLTMEQFQTEHTKARFHFSTRHRKQHMKDTLLHHILSLMIYCNYDMLQYELSKTYRENNGADHNNFCYWGKYLKQAVHQFGTTISGGEIEEFYHGIGEQLLFPQYIGEVDGVRIFCPLSTSSSFEVALNFANHNKGLVVKFGDDHRRYFTPKYFSCAWLSDYSNEAEYLFIQNLNLLKINDICNVSA
eukprot:188843_1